MTVNVVEGSLCSEYLAENAGLSLWVLRRTSLQRVSCCEIASESQRSLSYTGDDPSTTKTPSTNVYYKNLTLDRVYIEIRPLR